MLKLRPDISLNSLKTETFIYMLYNTFFFLPIFCISGEQRVIQLDIAREYCKRYDDPPGFLVKFINDDIGMFTGSSK